MLYSKINYRKQILIILFLISFSSFISQAQKREIKFDHITTANGLSQGIINCIYQDKMGFMWLGTIDGLNRYDGYNFKVYKNNPKNNFSISGNIITSIIEDDYGMLWIGTRNNGINIFDQNSEVFIRYKHDPNNMNSISHNSIRTIFLDSENNKWIGTLGGGLNFYNEKEKAFIHFKHDENNINTISDDFVYSILEEEPGIYWIGTENGGIDLLDYKNNKITHYYYDKNYRPNRQFFGKTLFKDSYGNIWIGTDGSGAYRFNKFNEKFVYFKYNPITKGLNNNIISSFYEDENKNIWIGTDGGGINIYNPENNSFFYVIQDPNNIYSISSNSVYNIFKDNSGTIWIGTFRGGLNIYNPFKYKFKHFTQIANDENSLSFKSVLAIYEDKQGNIWIGTDGGGLDLFNREEGTFDHYKHDPLDKNSISSNVIKSIYEDSQGNLWLGTYARGLNLFDRKNNKFIHYMNDPENINSIGHNNVWVIYEDTNNNLWIGLMGGGLDLFDKKNNIFKHYVNNENDINSLSCNNIKTIYEDQDGNFWIGTEGGGLNLFNRKTEEFTRLKQIPENPLSICNNDIRAIFEDSKGKLWFGTADGLCCLNKADMEFHTLNINDGLPSNVINGILEDDFGDLWISTNKGLSKYSPKTNNFKNYDVNDGIQGNEFNYTAQLKSSDGEMFFGGVNGFNSFSPGKIEDNLFPPQIVITDFKLYGKSINPGDTVNGRVLLNQSLSSLDEIILTHKENIFSIEFSALHFVSPQRNKYSYMLEGFDDSWINIDASKRLVTYMNLEAGSYIFNVKGSNSDGIWSPQTRYLKITILPPWWKTIWFKIAFITLIGSFLILIYLLRVNYLKSQRKLLELNVENKTSDLKQMIRMVREKSKEISDSGDVLNSKSTVLANGVDYQTQTAKQIEIAVDEVTSHIKKNTENARITNEITGNTVSQLEKIKSSTQKNIEEIKNISRKIEVLEEIYLQTNLLSLNASVEAARAGEYGRGFAIVAAEVRKLAEKSKAASEEIVNSAKKGAIATEEAGKLLIDFIPEIQKSASLIKEISIASIEQGSSIENISHSLKEFFKISNQHSDIAREISAVSSQLDKLAKYLKDQVMQLEV
ncbi:MAG: hypothetical protein JXB17_09325 [Bacteroidales bacterium]|nr:hypothetical protein [Bacteroidales bacterium]